MKRLLALFALVPGVLAAGTGLAVERVVNLTVENMSCASCPYIVKQALTRLPGVLAAKVSLEKKTAVVIFDHAKVEVATLTRATTQAGFPSKLVE